VHVPRFKKISIHMQTNPVVEVQCLYDVCCAWDLQKLFKELPALCSVGHMFYGETILTHVTFESEM